MAKHKNPKALADLRETLIAELNAKFSKEKSAIRVYSASDCPYLAPPRGYTPTGLHGIDAMLTKGKGVPWGRFIEVFGPESSGKTAFGEFLMGRFKLSGAMTHYFDMEASFSSEHLACYGVTQSDIFTPDVATVEDVWNYIDAVMNLVESRRATRTANNTNPDEEPFVPFFWDSVAQTPARAEMAEDSHDDNHVALTARAMSKGFRKHTRRFSLTNGVVLFVNQLRDNIGAYGNAPKTRTPGGRAMKYAYAIRLSMAKIKTLKKGDSPIGQICRMTTVKNKFTPYPLSVDIALSYTRGIDPDWSNFLWLQEHRQILPGGDKGVFKLRGQKSTFSRSGFGAYASEHPDLVAATVNEARDRMLSNAAYAASEEDSSDDAD